MYQQTLAQQVLAKYWQGKGLPVDPKAIAAAMGCQLRPFSPLRQLSGSFDYEGQVPVLGYDASEGALRQRFTIAHELGHFVLGHASGQRDPSKNFSVDNYDFNEVAANRFAAELLMPEAWVRWFVVNQGVTSLSDLARHFAVSEVAMRFRLKNLGLVQSG